MEKNSRSVIDYIMIDEDDGESIEEIIIDETREWTPYHIVKEEGSLREIYSDHSAIICKIKWKLDERDVRKLWRIQN